MYILTVIPIAKGIPFDTLSYYANENFAIGTIVTIPFGKQTLYAIVTDATPLTEAKSVIKSAKFSLKKIKAVVGKEPSIYAGTQALIETSLQTLTPIGSLAGSVISQNLFEYINNDHIHTTLEIKNKEEISNLNEQVITGKYDDRLNEYKRIIRSVFASKKSVVFVCPTIKVLEKYKESLEKGIVKNVAIFHSKITKKNLRSYFNLIKDSDRPVLIFTTPGFLVLPRKDIGTIIVESESSNLYQNNTRYKTDLRTFIRNFAFFLETKLVWGDTLPRFSTLKRLKSEHLPRAFVPKKINVVPTERYKSILPKELIHLILHAQKKNKNLYIYANRKGVAPISRCSDCGTTVICPGCEMPMVLRNKINKETKQRERIFICQGCSTSLSALHTCTHCGSWNITPVSIGTESIYGAILEYIKKENVFIIDDDITPDSNDIKKTIKEIEKNKFSIIIGTAKALPYIENVSYSVFPFFDRQMSTPSIYTVENNLRLIFECDDFSKEGIIIFTQNPEQDFLKQLETQKINSIIHDDLEIRHDLGYPPFGSIIKISLTLPIHKFEELKSQIDEFLSEYDITMLPPRRISPTSNKILCVWLYSVSSTYIEDEGSILISFMQSLKQPYLIEENPERFG